MKKIAMVMIIMVLMMAAVFATEWRVSNTLTYNDETEKFTNVKVFKNMNIDDFKWCKKDIETDDRKFAKEAPVLDSTFRIADSLPSTLDGLNKRYNYVEFQGNKYIKQNGQWYSDKSIYQNLISKNRYFISFEVFNPKAPDFNFLEKACEDVGETYLCDENPDNIETFYQDEKTYQTAQKDIKKHSSKDETNGILYICEDKLVVIVLVDNTVVVRTWNK